MPAIQNQQTGLLNVIAINNTQITSGNLESSKISEHNRTLSTEVTQSASAVELARGINKRYIRNNKKSFTLSFRYLPHSSTRTVDGKNGRDYLYAMAQTRGVVYVKIKLDPDYDYQDYTCYITSYTEKLLRRDIANQCSYYDVNMTLEEQ